MLTKHFYLTQGFPIIVSIIQRTKANDLQYHRRKIQQFSCLYWLSFLRVHQFPMTIRSHNNITYKTQNNTIITLVRTNITRSFFVFSLNKYKTFTLLVPSVFLVNDKYEEKMKEGEDEWFKVMYIFTIIFSSQVRKCTCVLQLRYSFKRKPPVSFCAHRTLSSSTKKMY